MNKILTSLLLAFMLAALGTLAYTVARPGTTETFTEFYILGPGGKAEGYPQEAVTGRPVTLVVGVANREQQDMDYTLSIELNGSKVLQTGAVHLAHEQKWEQSIAVIPGSPGKDQKLELLLYRSADSEPYRQLYIWLDVVGGR